MSKGSFGEPWRHPEHRDLPSDDGSVFCGEGGHHIARFFSKAYRERAIACVNALAGISNPVDAVEKARESLHNAIALWGHLSTDETQKLWLAEARAALAALGDGHE